MNPETTPVSEEVFEQNLTLESQYQPIIPAELRESELVKQMPSGDVIFVDSRSPSMALLIDNKTWMPIVKTPGGKGSKRRPVPQTIDLSKISKYKKFALIILHTPPRTPEDTYHEIVNDLSSMQRRSSQKEGDITVSQQLGIVAIVEDMGENTHIGWREKALTKAGIVVDKEKEPAVIVTKDYIISMGRAAKKHTEVNLFEGKKSRYIADPSIEATENRFESAGNKVDTDNLRREARASNMPPRTLANLKDGGNIVITDPTLGCSVEIDQNGVVTPHHASNVCEDPEKHKLEIPENERRIIEERKVGIHRPGDLVETNQECPRGCGHMLLTRYEKGRKDPTKLFKQTFCHEPHADGYPQEYKWQFVRKINEGF